MGPTGVVGGCGACMGPTRVLVCAWVLVVRAWVLEGCWCVHASYRGGGTCMGPTVVFVCAWVLQGGGTCILRGWWCVHVSYMGVGACMGPTGVVVRVWVRWCVQGWWYVHGSYRGGGVCMGPRGVLVRAWVLQGWVSTNTGMDWNGMDYWNGLKNQIPWVNSPPTRHI